MALSNLFIINFKKMDREILKLTDNEIRQEMKDSKSWDSKYFELKNELESREEKD